MAQDNCSTGKRTFTHLTETERGEIAAYKAMGLSLREIGLKIGRNPSTFSRELKRGAVQQIDTNRKTFISYYPDAGARVYQENRENCGAHSTVMAAWEFVRYAEEKILQDKWSPDAVVGYTKRQEEFKETYIPSTKTLYNWIDEGKLLIINLGLAMKLRRSTKTKKSRENKQYWEQASKNVRNRLIPERSLDTGKSIRC